MNYNQKTKLMVIGWLVGAVLGTMPCQAQDSGFPDVPKDHWAYQAVTDLTRRGILRGYPAEAAKKSTPTTPRHREKSAGQKRSSRRGS